jgi:hypothetical protein
MRLSIGGLKNKEIAKVVGCSHITVCNTLNNPLAMEAMAKINEVADINVADIQKQLRKLAPDCLRNLEEVLNGTMPVTPELKVRTSQDVLDRIGASKIQQVHTLNMSGHFTSEDLRDMKKRALDAIDVESCPPSGGLQDADKQDADRQNERSQGVGGLQDASREQPACPPEVASNTHLDNGPLAQDCPAQLASKLQAGSEQLASNTQTSNGQLGAGCEKQENSGGFQGA